MSARLKNFIKNPWLLFDILRKQRNENVGIGLGPWRIKIRGVL